MGTTLGTFVMQQFPYGIPKLMISTLASGFTAPFVGLDALAGAKEGRRAKPFGRI
jgi:uncharacterized protein (UPF0261 family)